jgi:hypothetical protein
VYPLFLLAIANATVLAVPSDAHSTIQSAIDATSAGDTVQIGPGEWTETLVIHGAHSIDLRGQPGATLRCIADCLQIQSGADVRITQLDIVGSRTLPATIWVRKIVQQAVFANLMIRDVNVSSEGGLSLEQVRMVDVRLSGDIKTMQRNEIFGTPLDRVSVESFTHNTLDMGGYVDPDELLPNGGSDRHHNLIITMEEPRVVDGNLIGQVWFSDSIDGDFRVAAGQPIADGYGAHAQTGPAASPLHKAFFGGNHVIGASPDGQVLIHEKSDFVIACPTLTLISREQGEYVRQAWQGPPGSSHPPKYACLEAISAGFAQARAAGVLPVTKACRPLNFTIADHAPADRSVDLWFDHQERGYSAWATVTDAYPTAGPGCLHTTGEGSYLLEFEDESGERAEPIWVPAPPAAHCTGDLEGVPLTRDTRLKVWGDYSGVMIRQAPSSSAPHFHNTYRDEPRYAESTEIIATGAVQCQTDSLSIRGRRTRQRWIQVLADREPGWIYEAFLTRETDAGRTLRPRVYDNTLRLGSAWLNPTTGRPSDVPVSHTSTQSHRLAYESPAGSGQPTDWSREALDATDTPIIVLRDGQPIGTIPGEDADGPRTAMGGGLPHHR